MNPIIDLSQIYNIFYNVQSVTVHNPDGSTWTNPKAIKRIVYTDMVEDIGSGTMGQRTFCDWLFFKSVIPNNLIPQLNTYILDSTNTKWYVSDVENLYFGNVLKLKTESKAGIGVQDEQFPPVTTTTSTTLPVTTSTSTTCSPVGIEVGQIAVNSFTNFCATPLFGGLYGKNTLINGNTVARIEFIVADNDNMVSLTVKADATGLTSGSAYIYRNGIPETTNFAGGSRIVNFANPSTGDIWKFEVINSTPLQVGAVNCFIKSYIPVVTTTSTTPVTTSSTTT
jgi:hypothetical protein